MRPLRAVALSTALVALAGACDDEPAGEDPDGAGVEPWDPPIVETVADRGEGIDDLVAALDDHRRYLAESGRLEAKARTRYAEEIRTLLREDARELLAEEIEARGGLDERVEAVLDRETDPYAVAEDLLEPLADCVAERRERD
jgi:LAO/AO transport system kinase